MEAGDETEAPRQQSLTHVAQNTTDGRGRRSPRPELFDSPNHSASAPQDFSPHPRNGGVDPGPPQGGPPDILGTGGEATESVGTSSEPPSMADAMWHPNSAEKQTNLMTRLNRIFNQFWRTLENKMLHTTPEQTKAHSPSQQTACPQQTPTALAKGPKWL
ncbi:Hypothetical predicted protein [Pelobates cultripes]|uniref:Uncharacterized protein n=1 Tax=Pelobates cultripes TaxID=61616 RepID=A0AAD1TJY3_PELCU|nr:Hypothetical predicted protein [Pelobates cultripes]